MRDSRDDTRYSERMQDKRDAQLEMLLKQIRDGDIKGDDVILKYARELGYSREDINKMLSEEPDETKDED